MADPLRRTLSKLRGKRSKKGPAGGLSNGEGNEQPGGGGRRVTPETCNGGDSSGPPETRRRAAEQDVGCRVGEILLGSLVRTPGGWCTPNHNNNNDHHLPGCRRSHYSNVDTDPDMGCYSPPSQPPDFEAQWPPHGAAPPLNFIYPHLPEPSGAFFTSEGSSVHCVRNPPMAGSFYGGVRNHSEDSEEDDYYENLIFCGANQSEAPSPRTPLGRDPERKGGLDLYLETDRLRSQLQEAYYLLIHAMHDMPLEGHARKTGARIETCPSSSQSQDSVYSQSSARVIESDVWSSDEASPKQASRSDLTSMTARRTRRISKSVDAVSMMAAPEPLRKCRSDSWVKYSPGDSSSSSECGHQADTDSSEGSPRDLLPTVHWRAPDMPGHTRNDGVHWTDSDMLGHSRNDGVHWRASEMPGKNRNDDGVPWRASDMPRHSRTDDGVPWRASDMPQHSRTDDGVPWRASDMPGHSRNDDGVHWGVSEMPGQNRNDVHWRASKMSGHNRNDDGVQWRASEMSRHSRNNNYAVMEDPGSSSPKPSRLTVKKMQKWMYKGRLLSLEVKERLIGSSQRAGGALVKSHKSDHIENTYTSAVIRRDLKVAEVNHHNLHNNHITVSKKRNWLTQSSHRHNHMTETHKRSHHVSNSSHVVLKETVLQLSRPDRDASSRAQEAAPSTPVSPQAAPAGPSDLSEDNDADDEGEIWYNPIPEDDEPYLSPKTSSDLTAPEPGYDVPEVPARQGCLPSEPLSPASDNHAGDSLDSSDYGGQLCKQRFVGKTVPSLSTEDPPACGAQDPGPRVISPAPADFSPPCSPNPVKKGGSINWSLPDKIKSPRTVRKLSMKMKKLPELSRKLSVKGTSWSHSSSDHPSSKGNGQEVGHAPSLSSSGQAAAAASRNVISRYHLDSSVSSQHSYKKKTSGTSKSSSKGGYLSDGDSPELIAKSGKHGAESRSTKGKEPPATNGAKSELDIDAFRHYSFSDQPKCFQLVSGLMSAHFYGAEDLKPPRIDSKDVFCAIQVDSVNKARTALLTCRTSFLDMDHTFNIELENAQHLKLVVFSWDPTPKKNRVCCHGTVILPALFRVTKSHQLAVKLEPRGLIYVKLSLMEQWENSADRIGADREPVLFGVDARQVVEKENSGLMVPLLMDKCIMEIEKRGCQVVGLYRLCGSAAVKKELREAFERDSKAIGLCENDYPDINVITGVLKDYLRELPSPLITKQLYEAVLHAMAEKPLRMCGNGCDNDPKDSEQTVELLHCLPDVEKATLKMLLDHLKLVASYHEVNKMTCQNLAVCFGPVLLSQRQETSNHNNRVFIDSEELASALDFKKHIEVLHYLLQLWPVKNESSKEAPPSNVQTEAHPCLRRKKSRPQMLNLAGSEMSGVLRPRAARLDSPSSNRYAGDWSSCQGSYLIIPKEEADYANVASESPGDAAVRTEGTGEHLKAKEHPLCSPVTDGGTEEPDVNLHDLQESIDTLIGNLERELSKNKLSVVL